MESKNPFENKKVSQRLPSGLVILSKSRHRPQFRMTLPVMFVRQLEWGDSEVLRITLTGKGLYIEKHKKSLLELRAIQLQRKELDKMFE